MDNEEEYLDSLKKEDHYHFTIPVQYVKKWLNDNDTVPRLMDVLKMRLFIGYNTAEIALQMGCSRTRVYQLLEQAKRLAREFLAE